MKIKFALIVILFISFTNCKKQKDKNIEEERMVDELNANTTQVDTNKFHINKNRDSNEIKAKFSSNLRPNETILLNKIYTDTMEFANYNDDYDYTLLEGKKNGKEVALIYYWDWTTIEKYNFKYGDIIKVEWKMDSIHIPGDGEALDFWENAIDAKRIASKNKPVKFLWRADKDDVILDQSYNDMVINEPFCNTISNQEKAALGYVATFIGNACDWDGEVSEDRSNLKCKILTALNLGYQCSNTHLAFLKHWFSQDEKALKKLEVCVTMPETATVQNTFNEIVIITDEDKHTITVKYKVQGVNMRESKSWHYTQTDYFEFTCESINLINSKKSELTEENIEISEN